MEKLVECVPNFSEGRRPEVVAALLEELDGLPEVYVLDRQRDVDHHRSVITFAGTPAGVQEAAFRLIRAAAALIDLNQHEGQHPRMGAADVVPFVPLAHVTMAECVQLAHAVGQRVGAELGIPVFLYEDAATRPERKNLADVRNGGFEALRASIGRDPARQPDYGLPQIHPTAGAVAIGARFFLIAFNVNLQTPDVTVAKAIARRIRASNGGLPCVKALGLFLPAKGVAQVSLNLVNYTVTSPETVYRAIEQAAAELGVAILESELIGLAPRAALPARPQDTLKLRAFSPAQILEERLARALGNESPVEHGCSVIPVLWPF